VKVLQVTQEAIRVDRGTGIREAEVRAKEVEMRAKEEKGDTQVQGEAKVGVEYSS
jgi:hypothetical protein